MALDADAMASLMAHHLEKDWQTAKGEPLPSIGKQDRKLLLRAIARGVIEHLQKEAEVVLSKDTHKHDVKCRVTIGRASNHSHTATCTVEEPAYRHQHRGRIE